MRTLSLIPTDRLFQPAHSGYRGWLGHNPNVQLVRDLHAADVVYYHAWGDSRDVAHDLETTRRFATTAGRRSIIVFTGDARITPGHDEGHHYFVANPTPNSTAQQTQVPYSYHAQIKWWLDGGRPNPEKQHLAGFRGSFQTNPVRRRLMALHSDDIVIEECDGWQAAQRGEWDCIARHNALLEASLFALCPRGIGSSSIRVVEAIFRGAIPVLLDDPSRLFDDPMDFALRFPLEGNLDELADRLRAMPKTEIAWRLLEMNAFCEKYLLRDHHANCRDTLGYTEFIREKVMA